MLFPGGIESLSNGSLILSVVAALAYLFARAQPPSFRRTFVKTASIALLAVLVWIEGGPAFLVIGLLLSAAGDAFLAHDGERAFLGGLASFLLGHIVYIALFVAAGDGVAAFAAQPSRIGLALLAAVSAIVMLRLLWRAAAPALRWPIAAYVATILAMCLAALTLPSRLVIAGAVLFLVSDMILAIEKFLLAPTSPHRAWAGSAVWISYYLAQLSIALGFLL
ncbi:lysoplasmalogenase [Aquamicrobium sp. LC103]|uniref:lysoplasmalogenase n=1 Tax=Aquamicrobium sp. LC103 TaxID=1120658 RepID=UPI00063EC26C|nr:lysoplasmalogenase [Aquamicrobium sp. LC103]TKT75496.1 lysoplasmalogenase [Aquamicrobium sp. LC103]